MWQYETNCLYHFGVPGMRWRNRKGRTVTTGTGRKQRGQQVQSADKKAKIKKGIKIGAAVAGTAIAAYGLYSVSQIFKAKSMMNKASVGRAAVMKKFGITDF